MRILLVEDDPMIGESTRDWLRQDGFAVDWVRDGTEAEEALAHDDCDLVVLDLGLPGRSGLEVLRGLRGRGSRIPVLILTARDAVADRVAGLDAGSDDYVIKPFDLSELSARVRALWRRRLGRAEPLLEVGALALNPGTHEARLHGRPVALAAREFALLQCLMERPGAILSRAQLEDRLYGWDDEVESNAVEVYIHHLRRKLGRDAIRTVRGVGYIIAGEP
ncbi:MAG TPA: response regulator transcription factor [bacterium]|nr:response regulator transcription factor [bacterium]